jgi:hypothetical protein
MFGNFMQRDSSTLCQARSGATLYIGDNERFFVLRDIIKSLSSTIRSTLPFADFIDRDKMTTLSPTDKKILASLARLRRLQNDDEHVESRQLVAALSNLLINSTFRNACCKLNRMNLVECPSGSTIRITSHGMQVANDLSGGEDDNLPSTNEAIQDEIKNKFVKKHKKALQVFELIVDGRDYNKRELGIQVGCPTYNSTIRNAISYLSIRKIVEYPNPESVRLSDMCFPFGRPIHQPSAAPSSRSGR